MMNKESPKTAFDLLYTRFNTAPKMVIYDNACNLHRYVLRRAPRFFSRAAFRIDRLHIFNHVGCSSGYNLEKYPQDMAVVGGLTLRKLNSQACEQSNSILERIRTQVAYMGHENAFTYCKYFLSQHNVQAIERLAA
ncbi:hypothetical protein WJX75_003857 [Coccomyxa subellipsoidea]|uniref:Uncharacterized protein n=1 Tax=Coccomyxa subellipsoidea TaxID=248742 RepID=A0ABR2YVU4_9CHLO